MKKQPFDKGSTTAQEIIIDFLLNNNEPTADDWKQLIKQHPEHAGDIADAALLRQGSQRLVEADVAAPANKAVYEATVSEAINLLHRTPSPQLAALEQHVAAVSGAKARKLAAEVGLGSEVALLNSILAGTVVAPRRVMLRLSTVFDTSVAVLAEFFARLVESREIPAFKATVGKPQIPDKPASWDKAVRSLNLPPERTRELLKLDE
jgi:hypothetical protein